LRADVPILAVIGRKNSGKTTVVEGLISELARRKFQVAAVKHISQKSFSVDTRGKDTWRLSTAGANPVIAVSDEESIIKMKNGIRDFSLNAMLRVAEESKVDVLVLEGFSSLVLEEKRVGKVICLRDQDERKEFGERSRGEVLAFCSFQSLGEPVLRIQDDLTVIVERAIRFIEKREKILEILDQLPGLDCGKCGRATCEELAEDIYEGQASLDDCIPLKIQSELKAKIRIGNAEVPIQPFVSEIIRKSVLAMVSTLKGVTIEGDEEVRINIKSKD
jgi:molybdopterin-guanine dinucleotide biosynthesis protein MobB